MPHKLGVHIKKSVQIGNGTTIEVAFQQVREVDCDVSALSGEQAAMAEQLEGDLDAYMAGSRPRRSARRPAQAVPADASPPVPAPFTTAISSVPPERQAEYLAQLNARLSGAIVSPERGRNGLSPLEAQLVAAVPAKTVPQAQITPTPEERRRQLDLAARELITYKARFEDLHPHLVNLPDAKSPRPGKRPRK